MDVKIIYFDDDVDVPFIDYEVRFLLPDQIKFLDKNLSEETWVKGNVLVIRVRYNDIFPFQSEVAKCKLDDFVAREEIEMNLFLSSFLEDSCQG